MLGRRRAGIQDEVACTVCPARANSGQKLERGDRACRAGRDRCRFGRRLIKQRVARQGQGRSGGYRTIVAYRAKGRAIFLFGFAKSERENIEPDELLFLRQLAENWLAADAAAIRDELETGSLQEIEHDQET